MKIEFTRSGGFANIPMTVTLDTASMPAAAAKELEAAIKAADFFNLPSSVGGGTRVRDAQEYAITATTPERRHSVVISDPVPPAVQPLVDHLVRAARAARTTAG